MDLYFHGLEAPLCYFPKTCFAAIQSGVKPVKKTGTVEWAPDMKALSAMANSFHDSGSGAHLKEGEGKNAYIQQVWPEWNDETAEEVPDARYSGY